MRQTLLMAIVLTLAGAAAVPAAAQISGGGMGGGGMGGGGMGGSGDDGDRAGRHRSADTGESGGAKKRDRSASMATPPKPGEVVKKGLLKLPDGLGGDKVHTAYLEAAPR